MNFIANESADKLRGGYYTPADIASFLVRWVLARKPRSILEPSCGDGAFIRALSDGPHADRLRIVACELDPAEAAKSRDLARTLPGTEVHDGDFLAWASSRILREPEFDAVVGNPPFIRYQYLPAELQDRAETLIRHFGLRFTRHTNAWVPFVIGALARLRAGGRLAMVVPSELLHVLHADAARRYLLAECSRVLVIDPEEIWFEDTLQGVVLLMAEKRADSARCGGSAELAIERTRGRGVLSGDPSAMFDGAAFVPGSEFTSKWTGALMTASERKALSTMRSHTDVRLLGDIATAAVGIVTGANDFFLVSDAVVEQNDLSPYVHPMFGRSDHVAGVVYDAAAHAENRRLGQPTNFVWFDGVRYEQLTPGARAYVRNGEAQKLHERYKCRIRTPWYSVPNVVSAPLALLKRSHDHPRLILNALNAYTTDTAYRITPRGVSAAQLVHDFVNSLTALTAELEGRHYGGGVLELVPSEIARLLVPLAPLASDALEALDASVRSGMPAHALLEQRDRRVLGALGISVAAQQDLLGAWWAMRNRRHRHDGDQERHARATA